MAIGSHPALELSLVRRSATLGVKFLRFGVIWLMCISIVAPVVRINADLWVKLDQLLLPVLALIYLLLMLAGFARPIRWNALFFVAVLFFVSIACSLVYGTQILGHPLLLRDLFDLVKPFLPWLYFTMGYEAEFDAESLEKLNRVLLISAMLICGYALAQWFNLPFATYLQPYYSGGLHDDGSLAHYRRVYSTVGNPNFLGMLMTWMIAVFSIGAFLGVGRRLPVLVGLIATLVTLAMTGSRYGLIDTALLFVLICLLPTPAGASRVRRKALVLAAVPLALMVIIAVSLSNSATLDRFQQLRTPLQESSLRMRLDDLWSDAWQLFVQSPVLGHGPAKVIFSNVYTDSEYLQVLKQFGIVGMVPYLCLFLVPLRSVWRGLRSFGATRQDASNAPMPWAVCVSFTMIVTALFMNIGMSTYYNFSLVAFLWMWMGIGVSSADRFVDSSRLIQIRPAAFRRLES